MRIASASSVQRMATRTGRRFPRARAANRWPHWRTPSAGRNTLRQGARFRGQAAEQELGARLLQAFFDVAADLLELLLVNDGADVARLVQGIANSELGGLLRQRRQEPIEDVGVQEQARTGRAGLALPSEAHGRNDAVDHPVLHGVRIDDGGALAPSSSETGTMRSAAARMMSLPTSVEPVKESLRTPAWPQVRRPPPRRSR
jgi:hypothetical protein